MISSILSFDDIKVGAIYHTADLHIKCPDINSVKFNVYTELGKNIADIIVPNPSVTKPSFNDVLVIAGDIFDVMNNNSNATLMAFEAFISTISPKVHSILIMGGNHDVAKDKSCVIKPLCKSVDNAHYIEYGVVTYANVDLTFVSPNAEDENSIEHFPKAPITRNKAHFGVYHGIVGVNLASKFVKDVTTLAFSRRPKELSWFKELGYSGIMLGDIHTPSNDKLSCDTIVSYSGSPIQISSVEKYTAHSLNKWSLTETGSFEGLSQIDIPLPISFKPTVRLGNVAGKCVILNGATAPVEFDISQFPSDKFIHSATRNDFKNLLVNNDFTEKIKKSQQSFNENYSAVIGSEITSLDLNIKEIPKLSKVWCCNLFGYTDIPIIDLTDLHGIVTVKGCNGSGKSNLIRLALLSIYGQLSDGRTSMALSNVVVNINTRETAELGPTMTSSTVKYISDAMRTGNHKVIYMLFKRTPISICTFTLKGVDYLAVAKFSYGASTKKKAVSRFVYEMATSTLVDMDHLMDKAMMSLDVFKTLSVIDETKPLMTNLKPTELIETIDSLIMFNSEANAVIAKLDAAKSEASQDRIAKTALYNNQRIKCGIVEKVSVEECLLRLTKPLPVPVTPTIPPLDMTHDSLMTTNLDLEDIIPALHKKYIESADVEKRMTAELDSYVQNLVSITNNRAKLQSELDALIEPKCGPKLAKFIETGSNEEIMALQKTIKRPSWCVDMMSDISNRGLVVDERSIKILEELSDKTELITYLSSKLRQHIKTGDTTLAYQTAKMELDKLIATYVSRRDAYLTHLSTYSNTKVDLRRRIDDLDRTKVDYTTRITSLEYNLKIVKATAKNAEIEYNEKAKRRGNSGEIRRYREDFMRWKEEERQHKEAIASYAALKLHIDDLQATCLKYDQITALYKEYADLSKLIYPFIREILDKNINKALEHINLVCRVTIGEGATGKQSATIEIKQRDNATDAWIPVSCASGYQRLTVDLAIRVSIYDIRAAIIGTNMIDTKQSFLFIDEALHRVDNSNAAELDVLLNHLLTIYNSIFVISHDATLNINTNHSIALTTGGFMTIV